MSPTQRGVLKGLRLARELALAQAKAAEEAATRLGPLGHLGFGRDLEVALGRAIARKSFAKAHAQILRAYARKLDREINRARGAQEELLP